MRRSHRKSRYGCGECKQRHSKCDEARPSCTNCTNAKRRCSYLNLGAVLPPSPSPSPSTGTASIPPVSGPSASDSASTLPRSLENTSKRTCCSTPDVSLLGERYSLLHLELLHHLQNHLGEAMGAGQPGIDQLLQTAFSEAFTSPFLMDQILALSAAHRSTLADAQKDFFLTEATRLQTRALAEYNTTRVNISEKNCAAVFLFSAFLGQQALFDTFSQRRDLGAFLDKLVQCLALHRGIALVAGHSWADLQTQLHPHFDPYGAAEHSGNSRTSSMGRECAPLADMFNKTELSQSSVQACRAAAETLQRMFDLQRAAQPNRSRHFAVVQEWPVRVSGDYIDLLAQRRPEAMIVLAHYAVLLLNAEDYWVVGDVGRFLIRSINDYLGAFWEPYLKWPNSMLEALAAAEPPTGRA